MSEDGYVQGFEVPVHRSLTKPILMAGVPREVMILNATLGAVLVFGLGTFWVLPFNLVIHLGFVSLCKHDPEMFEVLRAHLWQSDELEV